MAYEKVWAKNERLNKNEINKLAKDGLSIFADIPNYAESGFESIPKDQYMYFKYAGLTVQQPQDKGLFMMRVKVPSGADKSGCRRRDVPVPGFRLSEEPCESPAQILGCGLGHRKIPGKGAGADRPAAGSRAR